MNRDEVISGLEKCAASECNEKCPYNGINYGCRPRLMLDAVELLKEQEPKQVIGITDSIEGMEVGHCPSCDRAIVNKKIDETRFCKFCGQAIKWD